MLRQHRVDLAEDGFGEFAVDNLEFDVPSSLLVTDAGR